MSLRSDLNNLATNHNFEARAAEAARKAAKENKVDKEAKEVSDHILEKLVQQMRRAAKEGEFYYSVPMEAGELRITNEISYKATQNIMEWAKEEELSVDIERRYDRDEDGNFNVTFSPRIYWD